MKPGFPATEMCALFSFHSSCEALHKDSFLQMDLFKFAQSKSHLFSFFVAWLKIYFQSWQLILMNMTMLMYFGLGRHILLLQSKYGVATANRYTEMLL